MQTFTGDFPLNFVQNLPVIASESEEKFDFSPSNVATSVQICKNMNILEEISDYKSDKFSPHDLYLPAKSYRIACTKIQNFEEKDNCASTISVDQNFGSDMILFESDMIFIGSKFQVHKPLFFFINLLKRNLICLPLFINLLKRNLIFLPLMLLLV